MDYVVTAEPIRDAVRAQAANDESDAPPLPTLGEILEVIAAERPDWRVACEPALRARRVGRVRIAVGEER